MLTSSSVFSVLRPQAHTRAHTPSLAHHCVWGAWCVRCADVCACVPHTMRCNGRRHLLLFRTRTYTHKRRRKRPTQTRKFPNTYIITKWTSFSFVTACLCLLLTSFLSLSFALPWPPTTKKKVTFISLPLYACAYGHLCREGKRSSRDAAQVRLPSPFFLLFPL